MNTQLRRICFLLTALVTSVALHAADGAQPAAAPTPVSAIEAAMRPIAEKIKAKVQAGQRTEAALADDFKEIDGVLAAHKGEVTEDVAQILLFKAVIYLQVISNMEKGETVLKQLKTDYPATTVAQRVDSILADIAQQKEAMKLQAGLALGAVFPDFNEKDLSGQPLSIAKYKGKIVLIDFWATWCGPCVAELPNVIAAYKKFHAKGFEVIGVSLDKDEAALKKFIADKGMTWSQYFDGQGWNSKLGQKYGIQSIPATFLIGRDGKIIARDLRGEALAAELEKQLGR